VAGTRTKNGGLQNTSSGHTAGTEGLQEKAETAKEKLEGHHQTRSKQVRKANKTVCFAFYFMEVAG